MTAASATAQIGAPVLELRNVVRHFQGEGGAWGHGRVRVRAVDGVSLQLRAGETLGLVGESGCGKSTIGRLIVKVDEPTAGSIEFHGEPLRGLRGRQLQAFRRGVQMIFQDPFSSLNPRMTVAQTLAEPLLLHHLADRRAVPRRVAELMAAVGLAPDRAEALPHQFSGGQRQRIGIARALAVDPECIVCDEPVSALDVSIRAQVINLLQDLQESRGIALLFISHDLGVVRHLAHRVAVMYLGRVAELASKAELFARPLHPYTRALLSAIPQPDPGAPRDRERLSGELPSPIDVPAGCRFHPRCPHAAPVCRDVDPPLEVVESGHSVACHRWREIGAARAVTAVPRPVPAAFERRLALYRSATMRMEDLGEASG